MSCQFQPSVSSGPSARAQLEREPKLCFACFACHAGHGYITPAVLQNSIPLRKLPPPQPANTHQHRQPYEGAFPSASIFGRARNAAWLRAHSACLLAAISRPASHGVQTAVSAPRSAAQPLAPLISAAKLLDLSAFASPGPALEGSAHAVAPLPGEEVMQHPSL